MGVVYERAWFPGRSGLWVLVLWGVAYGRAWPLGHGFQEGVDLGVWLLGVVYGKAWPPRRGFKEGVVYRDWLFGRCGL